MRVLEHIRTQSKNIVNLCISRDVLNYVAALAVHLVALGKGLDNGGEFIKRTLTLKQNAMRWPQPNLDALPWLLTKRSDRVRGKSQDQGIR